MKPLNVKPVSPIEIIGSSSSGVPDLLENKPASPINTIKNNYIQPAIQQIQKPISFAQAFSLARKAGLKVFDYKGKKYGTQLKGEEPIKKPLTGREQTTQATVTETGSAENSIPTVNLPQVDIIAKKYTANIGGKEYGFSSEEKKNAFIDKVNKAMTDSLTQKKYGYNPSKNWYRTKI